MSPAIQSEKVMFQIYREPSFNRRYRVVYFTELDDHNRESEINDALRGEHIFDGYLRNYTKEDAKRVVAGILVRLNNGEILDSGVIATIRGHAYDPMSVEELWEKFAGCTARTHAPAQARELFDLLQAVDELRLVRDLPTCKTIFTS